MTDTNQNLRQAEQALLKRYAELVNSGDAGNWYQEAELEVIAARQALALPTADHLPDAGKMVNGLTKAETDASASVSGLTAAPVGERERFEREMSKPPFEFCMDRWPDDGSYAWPGNYAAYHTQCAWAAWQARAALSAGEAVDAQRYRWLMDNCTLGIKQNGVGWSLNTSACVAPDCIKDVGDAIDAAMRKAIP